MAAVELETARLRLAAPLAQDVDAVFEACQDAGIQRWTTVPSPYRRADAERFVLRVVPRGWADGSEETWAIRLHEGGALLGMIGARTALEDVGYWLTPASRGHGYLGEALGAVLAHRFAAGQAAVHWECLVGNRASARVARGAGFAFEGEAPALVLSRDGGRPPSWHGSLRATDDRAPKPGWPAELD